MLPGRRRCLLLAAVLPLAVATSACGAAGAGSEGRGELRVVASFYPLQWVTERVVGPGAEVSSLTPPGAEPHDLELVPRDVATLAEADLVVYLGGFQPAVDDAVAQEADGSALDIADAAHLRPADAGAAHTDDGRPEEAMRTAAWTRTSGSTRPGWPMSRMPSPPSSARPDRPSRRHSYVGPARSEPISRRSTGRWRRDWPAVMAPTW